MRSGSLMAAIIVMTSVALTQTDWTVSWRFEAFRLNEQIAELRAGGVTLLRLHGSNALAQTHRIADKLNSALWSGVRPNAIDVIKVVGGYAITLQNEPLLAITHRFARQVQSEPKALANLWAQRLRQVLSWRWLKVPLPEAVIAVGEDLTIPILGNAEGMVQTEAIPPELVQVKPVADEKGVRVIVRGLEAGAGILRIVKGNVGLRLSFRVMYRAAKWKAAPFALVRGEPSDAMIREAVENAILMNLELQSGAQWSLEPATNSNSSPNITTTSWRVQAKGEQLLPLDEVRAIPLRSFPQSLGNSDLLVISNDPETFQNYRVLCRGLLPIGQTVRFMIHHRNGMTRKAWLTLELLNTEDRWVWVTVRFSYGTPNESELRVGHEATAGYLKALMSDAAIRVALPPLSTYHLLRFRLNPRDTASALVEVRMDETACIAYRVAALPTEPPKTELLSGGQLIEAMVSTSDPLPYQNPNRFGEYTHTAGGQWTFISVGRFGLEHSIKGRKLHGNYGVIYRTVIKFVNPTDKSWKAQITVEAVGGVAKGSFAIDGRLIEVAMMRPQEERVLYEFIIPPKQTKTVIIVTVPSAGSFYPIQLIARTE